MKPGPLRRPPDLKALEIGRRRREEGLARDAREDLVFQEEGDDVDLVVVSASVRRSRRHGWPKPL